MLAPPAQPRISLADLSELGATLTISQTDSALGLQAQISAAPDFADAAWQALPLRMLWRWIPGSPRVAWVRFRDRAGALGKAIAVGPDGQRAWLPLTKR